MKSSADFKELVRKNVARFGFHVNLVGGGGQVPSFAYTIGLTEKLDFELLIAGCSLLSSREVSEELSNAVSLLLGDLGHPSVSKCEADKQWVELLLLGAIEYYPIKSLRAYQLISPLLQKSIDQPNTSSLSDLERAPWKWLKTDWDFPVPRASKVVTNTGLLLGEPALEAVRWEVDNWEVFSKPGPEVEKSEIRIVPLSVILGDSTNIPLVHMDTGGALWRASGDGAWTTWTRKAAG